MRVAIVRSDIQKIYLNDVESRVQRCFSREPPGQSRYFHKPTDAEFLAFLNAYSYVSVLGTDNLVAVDTTLGNNVLHIRTSSAAAYTNITVTSNAALAKTQLVAELNAGFVAAGLALHASLAPTTNKVQIDSLTKGLASYIDTDGLLLGTIIGIGAIVVSGLTVASLKAAIYPTPVTVDVSSATVLGLSTFGIMSAADQTSLYDTLVELVAPRLVETGMALLSFVYGNMSKMRSATFWPGGVRSGIPAGIAAAILEDDGVTVFTV